MSVTIPYTLDGGPSSSDVTVLWEGRNDGHRPYAALLDVPDSGYVFVGTDEPFTGRSVVDYDDIYGFNTDHVQLSRPEATEMAAVLVSTLLVRSNGLIEWFAKQRSDAFDRELEARAQARRAVAE